MKSKYLGDGAYVRYENGGLFNLRDSEADNWINEMIVRNHI